MCVSVCDGFNKKKYQLKLKQDIPMYLNMKSSWSSKRTTNIISGLG